jgi:hypothetical protein
MSPFRAFILLPFLLLWVCSCLLSWSMSI